MKLTLIYKKGGWHTNELIREARKRELNINTLKITDLNTAEAKIKKMGDVTIWLSSFLKTLDEKVTFFSLLSDRAVINDDCIRHPFLTRKLFQQKYLREHTFLNCIPTFVFKDKKGLSVAVPKILRFPFIQKPNVGSRGADISLIKSERDIRKSKIDVSKYVYQNFIKNDGDYRVFVVGGKVLGAIKRVAQKGNFLNNVSEGGTAIKVDDPAILSKLKEIALTAASVFDLPICGVDVIFNKADKKYYLLELNINPEWKGFQSATGVVVAGEIIDYCIAFHRRGSDNIPTLVKKYLEDNYSYLDTEKFHYSSRMYLWTRRDTYRKKLDVLKNSYLGSSMEEKEAKIQKCLNAEIDWKDLIAGEIRKKYLSEFPKIVPYNSTLFKTLFAETIYGEDMRPLVKKQIDEKDLIRLMEKLKKNKKATAALSTFAVNYLYNLSNYFKKPDLTDPSFFLDVFRDSQSDLRNYPDLRIYLLTHAIIGESQFYNRPITQHRKTYLSMLKSAEELLREKYFELSLDIKFEFMVCCRLCEFHSELENIIIGEAKRSLAKNGNFIISRLNDSCGFLRRNIADAEHRNVLYLMANEKFALN